MQDEVGYIRFKGYNSNRRGVPWFEVQSKIGSMDHHNGPFCGVAGSFQLKIDKSPLPSLWLCGVVKVLGLRASGKLRITPPNGRCFYSGLPPFVWWLYSTHSSCGPVGMSLVAKVWCRISGGL